MYGKINYSISNLDTRGDTMPIYLGWIIFLVNIISVKKCIIYIIICIINYLVSIDAIHFKIHY